MLFAGPPGCGKSTLAKIVAIRAQRPYLFISAPTIPTEFQNSGVQNLTRIFQPFLESLKPIVIILDELNALTDRHKNEKQNSDAGLVEHLWFLVDECKRKENILVIGTANKVKDLPEQLKNRFHNGIFFIPAPGSSAKKEILLHYAIPENNLGSMQLQWFMFWNGNRLSPRELKELVYKANFFAAMRKKRNPDADLNLCMDDLKQAMDEFNQARRLTSNSYYEKVLENAKKHWPIIMQSGISLFLQYKLGTRSLALSEKIGEEQLNLSKKVAELQLDYQKDLANKQFGQQAETIKKQLNQQADAIKKQLELQADAIKKQLKQQKEASDKQLDHQIKSSEKSLERQTLFEFLRLCTIV
jgi:DNA polymerase III delta prime subunit